MQQSSTSYSIYYNLFYQYLSVACVYCATFAQFIHNQLQSPHCKINYLQFDKQQLRVFSYQMLPIQEQLTCCYIEGQPHSLVMLRKPKAIMEKINVSPIYIWIQEDKQIIQKNQNKFYKIIGQNFVHLRAVQEAQFIVNSYNINIIICHVEFAAQIAKKFNNKIKKDIIKYIYCYGDLSRVSNRKYKQSISKMFKPEIKKLQQVFRPIISADCIVDTIRNQQHLHLGIRYFNDFVFYEDVCKDYFAYFSKFQLMINFNSNRQQMATQFRKLALLFAPSSQNKFIQDYYCSAKKGPLNQKAIIIYTQESFLHKLIKRLFISCQDPFTLFIAQPFIADLYLNIKKLYNSQLQSNRFPKQFRCFRGAKISQQQLAKFKQMKGNIVQNLGFLSTSSSMNIALRFTVNAVFIIEVKQEKRHHQIDFGFAFIQQLSYEKQEQQILFNPLNSFLIKKVEKKTFFWTIHLEYGELARLANSPCKLKSKQSDWILQMLRCSSKSLGVLLLECHHNYSQCKYYFQKFLQIAQQNNLREQILFGESCLAKLYLNEGKYEKSINKYYECIKLQREFNIKNEPIFDLNLGGVYLQLRQMQKALHYLKKALKKIKLQARKKNLSIFYTLIVKLGKAYELTEQYQSAIQSYQQAISILQQNGHTLTTQHAILKQKNMQIILKLGRQKIQLLNLSLLNEIKYNQCSKNFHSRNKFSCYEQDFMQFFEIPKKFYLSVQQRDVEVLLNTMANYLQLGQIEKAILIFIQCEQQLQIQQNRHCYSLICRKIGLQLLNVFKYEQALNYFLKSLKLYENANDPSDCQKKAKILCIIGLTYRMQHNLQQALKYYQMSSQINKLNSEKLSYAHDLNIMGQIYLQLSQYQKSLQFFSVSSQIFRQNQLTDTEQYAMQIANTCQAFIKLNQCSNLDPYFQVSIKILQQNLRDQKKLVELLIIQANIYFQKKEFKKSIKIFHIIQNYPKFFQMNKQTLIKIFQNQWSALFVEKHYQESLIALYKYIFVQNLQQQNKSQYQRTRHQSICQVVKRQKNLRSLHIFIINILKQLRVLAFKLGAEWSTISGKQFTDICMHKFLKFKIKKQPNLCQISIMDQFLSVAYQKYEKLEPEALYFEQGALQSIFQSLSLEIASLNKYDVSISGSSSIMKKQKQQTDMAISKQCQFKLNFNKNFNQINYFDFIE